MSIKEFASKKGKDNKREKTEEGRNAGWGFYFVYTSVPSGLGVRQGVSIPVSPLGQGV